MVTYMEQAVLWAVSWVLRRERNRPVAHRDLEHAHWDPERRHWYTHSHEPRPETLVRAA